MTRGERIADIIKRKFYTTAQVPEPADRVRTFDAGSRNPAATDESNPLGLPSHVPPGADSNDPTGTGDGGVL